MNAAQDQINRAVEHARKRKLDIIGYRPAVGMPTHADGSLRLVIEFQPIGKATPIAIPEEPRIMRGIRAGSRQGSLL